MNGAEKRAIARAAVVLVEDGDTPILDAGSTAAAFGPLPAKRRLRSGTDNLARLPFLTEAPGTELVVPGGALRATRLEHRRAARRRRTPPHDRRIRILNISTGS